MNRRAFLKACGGGAVATQVGNIEPVVSRLEWYCKLPRQIVQYSVYDDEVRSVWGSPREGICLKDWKESEWHWVSWNSPPMPLSRCRRWRIAGKLATGRGISRADLGIQPTNPTLAARWNHMRY